VFNLQRRRFSYVSPAYERLTGLPVDAVYDDREAYMQAVHPDDAHLLTLEALAAQGERGGVEFRFRRPDGAVGWLRSRWFPVVEDGVAVRVVGLAQDVTERRQAEEALEEERQELMLERERFVTLADNIDGVFWLRDAADGSVAYVSPAFETIWGISREMLYSSPYTWRAHIHPDDQATVLEKVGEESGGVRTVSEYRVIRPDGSERWVRDRAFPIVENGRVVRIAGIAEDVTERRRDEVALRESEEVHRTLSESLRRLGDRVEAVREDERARISREVHDELGQALTALKFDLHLLQERATDEASDRLAQMIETVEHTIEAVRRVCADLRPPMLDDLGLVAALDWQASTVERTTGIRCRLTAPDAGDVVVSAQIATEAFRIAQEALTNVARHADASNVDVVVALQGQNLELRIEDDGTGVDVADISSGLGILGMRERALRVNGSLDVGRSTDGGTAIVLRVPLDG